MKIKESNLNLSILHMVQNNITQGKIQSLIDMGFTLAQLQRMKDLSYNQIVHIASSQVLIIDVNINHQMFDVVLNRAQEHEARSLVIDKAISLGASIEVLNHYFGLSTTDISSSRKLKDLSISKGRLRKPSEQEKLIIWEKWVLQKKDNPHIEQSDDEHRLHAYMDITQHVSMLSDETEPLTLTSVINELEPLISNKNQ
ncbi:STY4526/YPO1902 family pathogenicity island replication protein [Orbus sturtevantii]|uniref:STY4526/YPO1902 family pathogenicity island replication protein n=1 Tax=Orbus sturtevantii TaxID=3074109 RepID=UPI00370D83AD